MKVTKDSIRKSTGLKRLPKRFKLFTTCGWLYDVLKANGFHLKRHLWGQTYWVVYRSLDTEQATINWRIHK